MNDRYLYRGKRKDNGEWVEGDILQSDDRYYIVSQFGISCIEKNKNQTGDNMITLYAFEVDPSTLCQCIGIKDKNGKLIWENDVVTAWSQGANARGKVKKRIDGLYIIYPAYQKQEFWGLYPDESGRTTVEVIGNVFDNLELLEAK